MKSSILIYRISRKRGFTLVEIMIVVAIIALLAAIAVPGFLRSRKRSQATAILNDTRIIDGAIDQYAIENNKTGGIQVTTGMLRPYFKPASRLYSQALTANLSDILGNNYTLGSFDTGVKVNTSTEGAFTDVIDNGSSFWGAYYQ